MNFKEIEQIEELLECLVCGAIVPSSAIETHSQWHSTWMDDAPNGIGFIR